MDIFRHQLPLHLKLFGLLLGLLTLSACRFRLNTNQVEADIKADIERQGRRVSLKAVTCPNNVNKQAEGYFRCVGELPSGEQFSIHVTQQDDQGTVAWDIPSSKALINLINLEGDIEDELGQELGKRFVIDCRDAYRINRRGDAFECDVVGGVTVGTDQIETVLVKVDPEGNLNWQEVRQSLPPQSSTVPAAASAASGSTTSGTAAPNRNSAPPPANSSLNQPPDDRESAPSSTPSTNESAPTESAND